MSVAAAPFPLGFMRRRPWARLVLSVAAVVLVAGIAALVAGLLAPASPALPGRAPFGLGTREGSPGSGPIVGAILALQASFYNSLRGAVAALRESGTSLWSLLAIGFAYGVFHAAGPGHGKAVIAAYLVANERAVAKAFGLSLAAAAVQAVSAILLVGTVAALLHATAATMSRVTAGVEWASFAILAALGIALTWRKAGKVLEAAAVADDPHTAHAGHDHCDHVHLPAPETLDRPRHWPEVAGVVLAAGIRPCAGALVVLVFALSQGFFAAGMAAVMAMALGTALTTGSLAALAVFAKALALRLAGGRGTTAAVAMAGLELLAAAAVLVLGLSLFVGLQASAGTT